MEMTYDWLFFSKPEFKMKIKGIIENNEDIEITWCDMIRVHFKPDEQYAYIKPFSPSSEFHYKIIPKKMSYTAILKTLEGNLDYFNDNPKTDIINLF